MDKRAWWATIHGLAKQLDTTELSLSLSLSHTHTHTHTHTFLFFKVAWLCPTLCNPMDYTVHGILQTRILFSSPGDLPNPGIKPRSPTLQVDSLSAEPQGKPKNTGVGSLSLLQRIILTQKLNCVLLHCRRILYQLSFQGSPPHTYMYTIIHVFSLPLRELGMYPPQIRGNDCTRITVFAFGEVSMWELVLQQCRLAAFSDTPLVWFRETHSPRSPMGTSSGQNNSVGANESLGKCRKSDALERGALLFSTGPLLLACDQRFQLVSTMKSFSERELFGNKLPWIPPHTPLQPPPLAVSL